MTQVSQNVSRTQVCLLSVFFYIYTRQQPASGWREAPEDLQVLRKMFKKSGPKTGPRKLATARKNSVFDYFF